jgi:hypothetical protein
VTGDLQASLARIRTVGEPTCFGEALRHLHPDRPALKPSGPGRSAMPTAGMSLRDRVLATVTEIGWYTGCVGMTSHGSTVVGGVDLVAGTRRVVSACACSSPQPERKTAARSRAAIAVRRRTSLTSCRRAGDDSPRRSRRLPPPGERPG